VAQLQQEIEIRVAAYRKYSESTELTRIDQALEDQRISNITIAQPATYNARPVRPNGKINLLLGILLGLIGGPVVALGADRLRRTLKTADDVERLLNLPVLLTVPRWRQHQLVSNGRNR
jgi:capsular polysaccharide biosynthesis protein